MTKGCVLVVDGSDDLREILGDLLWREGYSVVTAANGKEALGKLQNVLPNLIVTELTMPLLDGISFLEAVSQNDLFDRVPTILMTGADMEQAKARLHHAGLSSPVLLKPIDLHEFMALVEDGVGRDLETRNPRHRLTAGAPPLVHSAAVAEVEGKEVRRGKVARESAKPR